MIIGSVRSPGGGNGNPPQYSCLWNPMDRGGWWATARGMAKSPTGLRDQTHRHTHTHTHTHKDTHTHIYSVTSLMSSCKFHTEDS